MQVEKLDLLQRWRIVLASKSPRRQMLFEGLGLNHSVRIKDVDEDFPTHLKRGEIPAFLARKKADAFSDNLASNELLVTADTIVWINDHVLNKPEDKAQAVDMLREISGAQHSVYTAVCMKTNFQTHSFVEETLVHFNPLSDIEINHYLDKYQPYDKAGAYGIQEFIGLIGIRKIEGDFYNVVGFPMQRFWRELDVLAKALNNS